MAYYPDNSSCGFLTDSKDVPLISIGWLSREFDFAKRQVSVTFFRKLCSLLNDRWEPPFACAGFHDCDLCQFGFSETQFEHQKFLSRSTAELFIPDGTKILVSPISIAHYIAAHACVPPPEFIAAVEKCPPQKSAAYLQSLLNSGGRAWFKAIEAAEPPHLSKP